MPRIVVLSPEVRAKGWETRKFPIRLHAERTTEKMTSEDARNLAAELIAAADAVDATQPPT